jgi:nickel-dependent lactate racemase
VVRLPYGNKHVKVRAARGVKVLTPAGTRPIGDSRKYARTKISSYFSENRRFFIPFKNKIACVVVSDNTRYAFNHVIVPILLTELENVGIPRENITVLVALGLHAPMSHDDLIENMGQQVVDNYRIENHNANGELVSLGATTRGTPLLFNKRFMQSDFKIATGTVVPHFHAGFGGGYKSILPGISGKISILRNHSFDMVAQGRARYGLLEGNPIYEDIVEAGHKSGLHLIVNVTVDSEKRMTHLFIGEPEAIHRKAAQALTKDVKVAFDESFDVVVTTNGGYPLDRNLYQCVKGIAIGELMVKQGGTIILASECRDGVGHETFQEYMSFGKDPQEVLSHLRTDEPVEDQDNIQILARILSRCKVVIVTDGVDPQTVRAMKMEHARSVEDALRSCGFPARKELRVAIIPGGPYVLPVRTLGSPHDNSELG